MAWAYTPVMTDKYNYPPANYYAYDCLIMASGKYGKDIDEKTVYQAIGYLKRGAYLKD